jgi:transketolase
MRVEFVQTLQKIMRADQQSLFVTGDLGFNSFEAMQKEFGPRFLNAGAAEQNMVSLAAGLAFEGFHPWIYSIAPFVTYRPFEQTRNDVCLHNLPVRLVGNGGGYTYGVMGSTHHTLEDLGILKTLPNMHLHFPCTQNQVAAHVEQISQLMAPSYLRLSFSGFPSNAVPLKENPKTLTRTYSEGGSVTLIGVGHAVQIALSALEKKLIDPTKVGVFGVSKFPFDFESDAELALHARHSQNVFVIDEHYLAGSMAESLKMHLPSVARFRTLTPVYKNSQAYGSPKFQLTQAGMTPEDLAKNLA